uniref:Uncharacterized protein n=1 Tax=Siphoviridae sp. ctPyh10 TaxID=2827865 RepID=A0A8S5T013_9CAUD|nr:MAG TPA: hypothetical protein [Siphoviridae sp. ctPyh10]
MGCPAWSLLHTPPPANFSFPRPSRFPSSTYSTIGGQGHFPLQERE